jgi:hypothetical protein
MKNIIIRADGTSNMTKEDRENIIKALKEGVILTGHKVGEDQTEKIDVKVIETGAN